MSRETKAAPFSIRLRSGDDRFIREEARRLQRTLGGLVESYVSEAVRVRRFPGIAFRGEDYRRRAWVVGSGLDVWELVANLRDFGSEEQLAVEYGLSGSQIRVALAYYREFGDEIDALIARGRPSREEAITRYPFLISVEEVEAGRG